MSGYELFLLFSGPVIAVLGGLMIWAAGAAAMRWDGRRGRGA